MARFTGIWVALVTPFQNGAIDFSALQMLARKIAASGVAGLVVCGSTGEAASLDDSEQLAVLDAVLTTVPDCPIIMGLAGNHMDDILQRQLQMQARPIAGLLVPPPYYIRPSQAGLIDYFSRVAHAASVPLILYNIPYRTGVNIDLQTIRSLAQHERIVAIKDCGGDATVTMQLIADGTLNVLAGEDQQILSTLCLGGAGAITAAAHIRPDLYVRIAQLVQSEQLREARQLFYRLLPLIQLLFTEPNPAGVKAALAMQGLIRDECRAPMQVATPEMRERLASELKRITELCATEL
ncbi:MAG: 4-hydroxy-tetrahydrodipicolinate synthase [Burkholderiaceae bacterium]